MEHLLHACEAETNANSLASFRLNNARHCAQHVCESELKPLQRGIVPIAIAQISCCRSNRGTMWTNSLRLREENMEFRLTNIPFSLGGASQLTSHCSGRKRRSPSTSVTSTDNSRNTQVSAYVSHRSFSRDNSRRCRNSLRESNEEVDSYQVTRDARNLRARRRSRSSSRSSRSSTQGRSTFTFEQIATLKQHLVSRWYCPYFDTEEMKQIAEYVGLSKKQVHDWLRTTRSRKWRQVCGETAPHIFQLVTNLVERKICKASEMVQSVHYVFGERIDVDDIFMDPEYAALCKQCKREHDKYLSEQKFTKVRTRKPELADITPYVDHAPFEVLDSLNS